jgi:hypothetical protein
VKRYDAGGAGFSRQHAGLRRGEVAPLGGKLRVLLQECRLDEELVGAAGERENFCAVRRVESRIHHVGDSMPARRAQRVLLESAERDRQIVADLDEAVVRRAASHRLLGVVQLGADRKPELIEPLPPDVDP